MQKGRYIIQLIPSQHCDKIDQGSKALEQIATLYVDVKKGMISFPPENTGSRKNRIAVFVILMNMESEPFFFHSRNWFYCSSFVVNISSG